VYKKLVQGHHWQIYRLHFIFFSVHRRRTCSQDVFSYNPIVLHTESFVQPIHQPYITNCPGHRLCSTYRQAFTSHGDNALLINRTLYRVAYRHVSRTAVVTHSYPECCPGWRRVHSHNCNQAVCADGCANGGTCTKPNRCVCPPGWMDHRCQTDVDECSSSQPCSQMCLNTAGSFHCACKEGYRLAEDRRTCVALLPPTLPTKSKAHDLQPSVGKNDSGVKSADNVTEEVQDLKNRVELLEEKLHQALAPFNSLFPVSLDQSVAEQTSFLAHSFQQLDRIDSLSEQIGFLEERLETCSCQEK
ncbi:epidermal growth factor-like protein 7, partial [Arapaima gigas]